MVPRIVGSMRAPRLVLAAVGLLWLAGCASASPDVGPTGAAESLPPAACPAVSLLTPSGSRLELTGRWRGPSGGTYYLRQSGSCVWFVGLSRDTGAPGGERGSDWTNAFFGTLASDFTLRGSWADVPWGSDVGVGELAWGIDFSEDQGEEVVTLFQSDATGGFGDWILVRPDGATDLRVRLQESFDCLEVVTDTGDVYELLSLPPDWSVADPLSLYGPDGEVIRTSDAFAISGEVARGTGACGPGLLVFGDRFEAD